MDPKEEALGRGYNTLASDLRNFAFDIDDQTPPLRGAEIEYRVHVVTSQQDFRDFLDISAEASFGSLMSSVDVKLDFEHHTTVSSFRQSLVVGVRVTYEPTTFESQVLNNRAEDFLQRAGAERFFETYGDSYISDITYGGAFYASLEYECQDNTDYEHIGLQLKAATGSFSASTDFSHTMSTISHLTSTNMNFVKVGGDKHIPLPDTSHGENTLTALIKAASNFPSEVNSIDTARPILVATSDYYGALYKPGDIFADVSKATSLEKSAADDYIAIRKLIEDGTYVSNHPSQFISPDIGTVTHVVGVATYEKKILESYVDAVRDSPTDPPAYPILTYGSLPAMPEWLGRPHLDVQVVNYPGKSYTGKEGNVVGKTNGEICRGTIQNFAIALSPPIHGVSISYWAEMGGYGGPTHSFKSKDGQLLPITPDITNRGLVMKAFGMELIGDLANLFELKFSGHVVGVGQGEIGRSGATVRAPADGPLHCINCDDAQLHAVCDKTYFEAIWVDIKYKDEERADRERERGVGQWRSSSSRQTFNPEDNKV